MLKLFNSVIAQPKMTDDKLHGWESQLELAVLTEKYLYYASNIAFWLKKHETISSLHFANWREIDNWSEWASIFHDQFARGPDHFTRDMRIETVGWDFPQLNWHCKKCPTSSFLTNFIEWSKSDTKWLRDGTRELQGKLFAHLERQNLFGCYCKIWQKYRPNVQTRAQSRLTLIFFMQFF